MNLEALIEQCVERGIKLAVVGEELDVKAPKGSVTPELFYQLRSRKAELRQWIERTMKITEAPMLECITAPVDATIPLSSNQLRLWLINSLANGLDAYNIPLQLKVEGALNVANLRRAIAALLERHAILRTIYPASQGKPYQQVVSCYELPFDEWDLREFNIKTKKQKLDEKLTIALEHQFNLSAELPLRLTLLQTGEQTYTLLLVIHHIAADAWSVKLILRELVALYKAHCLESPVELENLSITYGDYAYSQQQYLFRHEKRLYEFWQEYLKDCLFDSRLPRCGSNAIKSEQSVSHLAGVYRQQLPSKLLTRIQTAATAHNSRLFVFMYVAYGMLLARYCNQSDIVIGFPIANRNESKLEPVVGYFSNTLLLRVKLTPEATLASLLVEAQASFAELLEHQQMPYESLIRQLGQHPESSLFNQAIIMQERQDEAVLEPLDWMRIEVQESLQRIAKFELSLFLIENNEGMLLEWEYDRDLLDSRQVERIAENYLELLVQLVEHQQKPVVELSCITPAEYVWQQQILAPMIVPDSLVHMPVHQRFSELARQQPGRLALKSDIVELSYGETDRLSDQIASALLANGLKPEQIVALALPRSVEAFVWILGILKAGGAYLPIDTQTPIQRVRFMLEDSKCTMLIADSCWQSDLEIERFSAEQWCLNGVWSRKDSTSSVTLTRLVNLNDLAYVIYTSGSTGQPKGVMIEHRGLANLAEHNHRYFGLAERHKVLQFASLCFDGAAWEWTMALGSGAALYICSDEARKDCCALMHYLAVNRVTHAALPPSLLALMDIDQDYSFEALIVAGEASEQKLIDLWSERYPMFNSYGPTEVTVAATIGRLEPRCVSHIGQPLQNTRLLILDEAQQPCLQGQVGELYVAGVGLARGYLNNPERTAAQFIVLPNNKQRLYRTGDLVRLTVDGYLCFVGRTDHQVKINGRRIELGEIEQALESVNEIDRAQVLVRSSEASCTLAAYLKTSSVIVDAELVQQWQTNIAEQLPHYMIPAQFIVINEWPLTNNGKIDRDALAAMDGRVIGFDYVAPRNDTERRLIELWASVLMLPLEEISVCQHFFELGGHSLMLIQLLQVINDSFELKMPMRVLAERLTIADLASYLDELSELKALGSLSADEDTVFEGSF